MVGHNYTIQVVVKKKLHQQRMMDSHNNNQEIYKWCDLLNTPEWNANVENPFDDEARVFFLNRMTA
jgi:hypothetical protein